MSRQKLATVAELEALSDMAVVYDNNNRVWQHGIAGLTPGEVNANLNTPQWDTTELWVTFASRRVRYTNAIALPAYLLDDGL